MPDHWSEREVANGRLEHQLGDMYTNMRTQRQHESPISGQLTGSVGRSALRGERSLSDKFREHIRPRAERRIKPQ